MEYIVSTNFLPVIISSSSLIIDFSHLFWYNTHMSKTNIETIGVRVDAELKKNAEQLFAARGSNLSKEIRKFLRRSLKRAQNPYYCQKREVANVMGGIQLGDTHRLQIVSRKTRVDC